MFYENWFRRSVFPPGALFRTQDVANYSESCPILPYLILLHQNQKGFNVSIYYSLPIFFPLFFSCLLQFIAWDKSGGSFFR